MSRKGFSLIELLIVVAIIAALVGVAVPFFQDNLQQAQQTKAKQDLDTIRNAISLHDAQNRPLTGTSLQPLLGRYLQELPKDPWGNEYALDANVGMIISFGADGQAGGQGGDTDFNVFYKPPLKIQRCQYVGSWGMPTKANKSVFTLTKPYKLTSPVDLYASICLLTNVRDYTTGLPLTFGAGLTGFGQTWTVDTTPGAGGLQDQVAGMLCLTQSAVPPSNTQAITPTMAVNFNYTAVQSGISYYSKFGMQEDYLLKGPLDTAVYGPQALSLYRRSPQPIPRYGDPTSPDCRNRGVKIERF